MTGSDMGSLIVGFLRFVCWVFSGMFLLCGVLSHSPACVITGVGFAAVALVCAHLQRNHDRQFYQRERKRRQLIRDKHPALYFALDKLEVLLSTVPGNPTLVFCLHEAVPFGTWADYELHVCVYPDAWNGDKAAIVGGISWDEWKQLIPKSVDGFKVRITVFKKPM